MEVTITRLLMFLKSRKNLHSHSSLTFPLLDEWKYLKTGYKKELGHVDFYRQMAQNKFLSLSDHYRLLFPTVHPLHVRTERLSSSLLPSGFWIRIRCFCLDPEFLPGSGSSFQISLRPDPDPVSAPGSRSIKVQKSLQNYLKLCLRTVKIWKRQQCLIKNHHKKLSRQRCLDPDLVLKKLRNWIQIQFVLKGWISGQNQTRYETLVTFFYDSRYHNRSYKVSQKRR